MRLNFIIILSFLVLSFSLNAQEVLKKGGKKFEIMPQVGVNFSKFLDEPQYEQLRFRTGYQIGFYLRTNRNVYIQPGLFYARQGNQIFGTDQLSSENIRDNVDYNMLRIPLLVGVKILNLRLYTGPNISFLTMVRDNPFGFNMADFRKAILGLNIGAGINIWKLTIDFNYEYGLTRLSNEINSRANVFSLNVGFHFKL